MLQGISREDLRSELRQAIRDVMAEQQEPLLTTKEVCRKMKWSDSKLRRLRVKHRIENFGTSERPLFKESDIKTKICPKTR